MDGNGDYVISDSENHRIRRCVAGTPSPYCQTVTAYGELRYPMGLAIDENGRYVIADSGNSRIQRCAALAARCETMVGVGSGFWPDGVEISKRCNAGCGGELLDRGHNESPHPALLRSCLWLCLPNNGGHRVIWLWRNGAQQSRQRGMDSAEDDKHHCDNQFRQAGELHENDIEEY